MTSPHDVPTVVELIDAVRQHLEDDVVPAVEGRVAFHAKVAARVLATVQRELELGPAQEAAHRARLGTLGVADDAELARAIRDGRFDHRWPEVIDVVAESVRDKLLVADPEHLELPPPDPT